MSEQLTHPGVAVGLAWTAMGGEILFVEATKMPGSGELVLTGQLGEPEREMEKGRDGNRKAEWSCNLNVPVTVSLSNR